MYIRFLLSAILVVLQRSAHIDDHPIYVHPLANMNIAKEYGGAMLPSLSINLRVKMEAKVHQAQLLSLCLPDLNTSHEAHESHYRDESH